jgi:SAM-dependent methyltransferase
VAARGSYNEFAAYYDVYWAAGYLRDFAEGLEETILPLVPPGARVLDLCCGTGRLAASLSERGFDVTGLDNSAQMLAVAQMHAPDARFVEGDARSFTLQEPVDLVLSTFDSVNHFASLDELESVFRCVHGALTEDGLFCFDFITREGFEYAGDETNAAVGEDHVCVSRSVWNSEARQGVSLLTVFERQGTLWRRTDAEVREYCHEQRDIEQRLKRAGFGRPRVFDALDDFGMPHGDGRLFLLTRPG